MQSKLIFAAAVTAFALPSLAVDAVTDAAGNATYDVSNVYEPFLTKTDTLIWPNRKLADIIAMTGINDGGWMSAARRSDGYFYNRTTDSVMVQLQANDGLCKTVRAYFTQKGNDIYGYADYAGYADSKYTYTELPENLFFRELATTPDTGAYGSYHLLAFGDASGVVDALPESAPQITVNGGTLQVNMSSDLNLTNTLTGTGGFLFNGTVNDMNRDLSYAWPSKTEAVLATGTSVYDIEIVDAVLNGSWCGRHEEMKPFFVTTNRANNTITAQLQGKWYNSQGGWWQWKAIGIELKQSGLGVTIRALWAATPLNNDDAYGTDASKWDTWTVPVVTSGTDGGYGLENINFKVHDKPVVKMSGDKSFEQGVVANAARVDVTVALGANRGQFVAHNGACICLDARNGWNCRSRKFAASKGSKLIFARGLAAYQDSLTLDASEAEVLDNSNYFMTLVMRNGSVMSGKAIRACLYYHANWTFEGAEECQILPKVGMCGTVDAVLTIDAKGSVAFLGGVTKDDGCSSVRKTGPDTLRIAKTAWNLTSTFTAAGGRIQAEANVTAGTFVAEDATEIVVNDGAKLTFADSSAAAWPIIGTDKVINFTGDFPSGAQKVRFGTGATALTHVQQKRLNVNGKRSMLDADGYLQQGMPGFMIFFQ